MIFGATATHALRALAHLATREDGPCPAHTSWSAAKDAFVKFLETTTLADIQGRTGPVHAPRSRSTHSTRRRKRNR